MMTRLNFVCLFLISLTIHSGDLLAQNGPNPNNNEKDQCAQYLMRVVSPSDEVDYKLIANAGEGSLISSSITNQLSFSGLERPQVGIDT
jgi:hypothetical protein